MLVPLRKALHNNHRAIARCLPESTCLTVGRESSRRESGVASEPALDSFRKRNTQEWTHDTTVAGWRKWHTPFAAATGAASALCVEAADVRRGHAVLDLASGSGEPAVTLARAVGPAGRVVASDLSPGMLQIGREQAQKAGLDNMRFVCADMECLPFKDASFDRITSRWGLMFVPDLPKALREIDRVLKPGGKVMIMGWGQPQQAFFACPQVLKARGLLPSPPPGAPNAFRFSAPGSLAAALRQGGLRPVSETRQQLRMAWPGSPASFFEWFYDIAAPFRGIFDGLDKPAFDAVQKQVEGIVGQHRAGDTLELPAEVVVGVAQAPARP